MKKDFAFFLKLFRSTFYLSAFTFGGGYVIVPLMRRKFVDDLHWIDEQEMLDLIAIAQTAPGPIAVNASILIGYHLAGVLGAIVTVLGTVLPPLITLSIVSLFYLQMKDNPWVGYVLSGMQAGVAAVILDVIYKMGKDILKQKELVPILILFIAFIVASLLQANLIVVILASGLIGILRLTSQDFRNRTAR